MILLFGQHLTGSMADRQYPLHGRVGSVGDFVPPVVPPTPEPSYGGAGGGSSFRPNRPAYIRRKEILAVPPEIEEDLILGITVLLLLETENSS